MEGADLFQGREDELKSISILGDLGGGWNTPLVVDSPLKCIEKELFCGFFGGGR
jgi:hypothetical protein